MIFNLSFSSSSIPCKGWPTLPKICSLGLYSELGCRGERKVKEPGCGGERKLKLFVLPLSPLINLLRRILPPHLLSMCFYILLELCRIRSCLWITQSYVCMYHGIYNFPFCRSMVRLSSEGHLPQSRYQKRNGKDNHRKYTVIIYFLCLYFLSMWVCCMVWDIGGLATRTYPFLY